jgi:hypothetical protein
METLKESLIEKLDKLPEPALREVMEFVSFLAWRGVGEDSSLLHVAGALSGTPVSAEQIEQELYEPPRVW